MDGDEIDKIDGEIINIINDLNSLKQNNIFTNISHIKFNQLLIFKKATINYLQNEMLNIDDSITDDELINIVKNHISNVQGYNIYFNNIRIDKTN